MKRQRTIWMLLLSLAVVGSVLAIAASGTPDRELGLSKSSVFEIPEPPAHSRNSSDPGDQPTVASDFPQQPVQVPHALTDFLPITLDENQCADCHAVEEKIEGEATPIPESHYVDLRNAPDSVRDEIAGARYNCVVCHVSPGDNPPLVGNEFGQ